MKRTILVLAALIALIYTGGCDPFGSEQTMAYITGTIYADSMMTVPMEGVAVELTVNPDSASFISQTVFTNASGVFFMEVQFFPSLPDDETGAGYTMPSYGYAGLVAHYGSSSYMYADVNDAPFTLSAGDTLTVWPVSIFSFVGGGSSK